MCIYNYTSTHILLYILQRYTVSRLMIFTMGTCQLFVILALLRREFARTIPRPFSVRYNPYTQSVEVIKDKPSIEKVINDVRYNLDVLQDAIGKSSS